MKPEPKDILAFKNGLLDIPEYCKGNIVLHDLTPDFFTFATLPYDFNPDLKSELIEDYCYVTFNGDEDSIRLLYQWLGYNIVYDTSLEKFMIFIGPTRSGKSTIMDAMTAMLGRDQCVSTSLSMLSNTHGLEPLIGKSAVIAGDIKGTINKAQMDAALEVILRITGQDKIPINPKYVPAYDIKLPCRFTFGMNDLPLFTDHSRAIIARTILLCFPNSYYGKEDFTLKERLKEEAAEGKLINFALEGLKDLRRQERFTIPDISQKALDKFVELTSPITAFIDECCLLGEDKIIQKDQCYDAWKAWSDDGGRQPGLRINFIRWLCQTVPTLKIKREDQIQIIHGITLKDWAFIKYVGRPA